MFVPNATLARMIRSVVIDPSPRQIAKIRALSSTGLIGTAAYAYYARSVASRSSEATPSALSEDTTSGLVRLKFVEAETIVRTMIAAAVADNVETEDCPRILRHLRDAGATSAEYGYAEAECRRPASPQELAEGITHQEAAMDVYAAALLATEGTAPPVRRFIARLAHTLDLPFNFLGELHARWGDTAPALEPTLQPIPPR